MKFQKIVLMVAGLSLVVMLIMVGYILNKGQKTRSFPPVKPRCPDYWTPDSTGTKCVNNLGLGRCSDNTIDMNREDWIGSSGLKNKCEWAKRCNLTWDGITNNDRIDC